MRRQILSSVFYFLLAGLCEIGGGYLIWRWMREGKSWKEALAGSLILTVYGLVATLQPTNFGRVYAAYGGFFITLAIVWGWRVDGIVPDRFDWLGGAIALLGACIIMYAPRG